MLVTHTNAGQDGTCLSPLGGPGGDRLFLKCRFFRRQLTNEMTGHFSGADAEVEGADTQPRLPWGAGFWPRRRVAVPLAPFPGGPRRHGAPVGGSGGVRASHS